MELLENHPHGTPERDERFRGGRRIRRERECTDLNLARFKSFQAVDASQECAFPAARWTYECRDFADVHHEVDIGKDCKRSAMLREIRNGNHG